VETVRDAVKWAEERHAGEFIDWGEYVRLVRPSHDQGTKVMRRARDWFYWNQPREGEGEIRYMREDVGRRARSVAERTGVEWEKTGGYSLE
jgi:hypothetical protein